MADGQIAMSEILEPQAPETAEAPPPEPASAQSGEPSAPPAQPTHHDEDDDNGPPVPRKALISERKKRQELERQAAELRGRYEALERVQSQRHQPAEQAKPEADEVDPAFFANPAKYVEQRAQAMIARAVEAQRVHMGVELMMQSNPDYQEMERVFVEQAQRNPMLLAQAQQARNPARFAYDWAKQFKALDGASNIDELKSKWRAEWEAEQKAAPAPKPVASNAGARSVGASNNPNEAGGQLSITEILRGKR